MLTAHVTSSLGFLGAVAQSLMTPWGLFSHYWILVKLLLTVLSTIVLLVHMKPIGYLAHITAATESSNVDLIGARLQLVIASGAAFFVLLTATALSIYKPRGMAPYGWRRRHDNVSVPGLQKRVIGDLGQGPSR
jgi:hypothetical protein